MLKSNTIEAVRHLFIVDVIGRYIELKKKGANYLALSPFTDEKTPSFTVFPKNNNFKCFSSGKQGDGITFVMEHNNLEFYEAIHEIASDHGIPIEEEDLTPEQKEHRKKEYDERKDVFRVLEYAKNHFLTNTIPPEWMKDRKYEEDLLTKFQVGYGSGSTTLIDDATKAGFSRELLKKAGLIRNVLDPASSDQKVWLQVDAYADRVIFPIHDARGNTVAFTARYNGKDEKAPKYINSPSSVWEKSCNLYGLYQAQDSIRKAKKVYLVEGPTDVISMHRCGINNTVCPCGTALTDDQCKLLRRYTENVCIVPDNDLGKKDNPGMKALERNALLLLKHGLFVTVLIPGTDKQDTSTDPDSFLRKIILKENVTKWLDKEERYIEDYFVKVCLAKAALGAKQKGEAFNAMVDIIESIHDDVFHQAYYESVCSGWPYFKKHKLIKRVSDSGINDLKNLRKEQRDTLLESNYYEENGAYYSYESKNKKKLSNFTYEAIFCVFHTGSDNKRDLKYVLRLKSQFGRIRLAVISSDDYCGTITFKKQVARLHGFNWTGNDTNLNDIKGDKNRGIPEAIELERVGWNTRYEIWVWSNGLFYDGTFHEIDKYGITIHAKKINSINHFKSIPPESQIKIENTIYVLNTIDEFITKYGESDLIHQIELGAIYHTKFFYLPYGKSINLNNEVSGNPFKENSKYMPAKNTEDKWVFNQWAESMKKVYPGNGNLLVAFYVAGLFSDLIYEYNFNYFPLLFMFGKRQSGKSTAARSIMWMFGKPPMEDGINLASGSTSTGMQRAMDSTTNHPFWGNEYKNNIHKNTIEALKGIADRSGKLTGVKSGGNETRTAKPRGFGIISGQDLPTQDPALLSRCLVQEYDDENRPNQEQLKAFKQEELTGKFTEITCELLNYREIIKQYPKLEPTISEELLEEVRKDYGEVDSRTILNMTSVLTPIKLLMDHSDLVFPFTYEELKASCVESIKLTISIQHQSDEVEQYFQILQSLININRLKENEHYKIKIDTDGAKLYLRVKNIHGLYRAQAKQEGITTLDVSVIIQYLKKHRTFIENKDAGISFGKQRTSGFIFNYDKLKEQGIELESFRTNGISKNYNSEVDLKNILKDTIDKLENEKPYVTDILRNQVMNKANQTITQSEFINLIDELNKSMKDKEIVATNNQFTEIYVKSKKMPF